MKTKNVVAIALAMIVSLTAWAKPGKPQMVVISQKAGVFKVIYERGVSSLITLRVFNAAGKQVFAEDINSKNGFSRPLNFVGMPAGTYKIQIEDNAIVQTEYVKVVSGNVVAQGKNAVNIHVAKTTDRTKYLVAKGSGEAEELAVRIYDGDFQLVLEDSRMFAPNSALVYDLRNVRGTPTFEIADLKGNVKKVKY
ncbi:MAG: hypothetical protein MUC38_00635 [Cyclobacteriaceae bacterium]|jgi:hypothetical protein|nr:hypothetical protein [Cyclobacteriaceae bacterium]